MMHSLQATPYLIQMKVMAYKGQRCMVVYTTEQLAVMSC